MNKELEALNIIEKHMNWSTLYWIGESYSIKKHFDTIETALVRKEKLEKLLKILKHKQILVFTLLDTENVDEYNKRSRVGNLTKEEYELSKEIFKNDY